MLDDEMVDLKEHQQTGYQRNHDIRKVKQNETKRERHIKRYCLMSTHLMVALWVSKKAVEMAVEKVAVKAVTWELGSVVVMVARMVAW